MTTTTKKTTLADRILADGRLYYIAEGTERYETEIDRYGDTERLPEYIPVEIRDNVHLDGNWKATRALIVRRADGQEPGWRSGVKKVSIRQTRPVGYGVEYVPTGEYGIPVQALSLRWVTGARYDELYTTRVARSKRTWTAEAASAAQDARLTRKLVECLGAATRTDYAGRQVCDTVIVDGRSVTIKREALDALLAKLGVTLD